MFTRDTFEQCRQLIELSRECLNVMFRRNADTIQGTCNTRVEYLLDFVELNFDAGLESIDVGLGFDQFAVRRFKFSGNVLFAFGFNNFTGLDQLLEVLAALLTDLDIGAQARQPDLAGRILDGARQVGVGCLGAGLAAACAAMAGALAVAGGPRPGSRDTGPGADGPGPRIPL